MLEGHVIHYFDEGHSFTSGGGGGLHGSSGVSSLVAGAAASAIITENLGLVAGGLLASELALGFGAEGGGLAFPCALGLLAERGAVGLGGSAGCAADSGAAHSLASGAVLHLTHLLGATNTAHGLFAVNLAFGTLSLGAITRRRKDNQQKTEGVTRRIKQEQGDIRAGNPFGT